MAPTYSASRSSAPRGACVLVALLMVVVVATGLRLLLHRRLVVRRLEECGAVVTGRWPGWSPLTLYSVTTKPECDLPLLVSRLSEAPQLHVVALYTGSSLTDGVLKGFPNLPRLSSLDVRFSSITDASCATLIRIHPRDGLNISLTWITEAGYRRVAAALPKCQVVWEPKKP